MESKTHPPKPALLALAIAVAVTGLLLALPQTFLTGFDYRAMHGFYREYFRQAVLSGEFPWWNPYSALGRPFFADIETACVYPTTWLALPLGAAGSVIVAVVLHAWLALWAGFRLAQILGGRPLWSWISALTFLVGGPLLARLDTGQITVFCSLCWLPAILLLGISLQDAPSRRGVAKLAVALALCLLAGSPNIFWIALLGLGLFLASRSESPRSLLQVAGLVAVSLALAAGLASIELFSFAELVAHGNRPMASAGYATHLGTPPVRWLSFVIPVSPTWRFYTEFNQFVGLPVAVGALCAFWSGRRDRNCRALLIVTLIGIALGAGDALPILGWLAHLPGFGTMRFPSRYGILTALSLCLAAPLVFSRLKSPLARQLSVALAVIQVACLGYSAWRICLETPPSAGFWEESLRSDLAAAGHFPASGVPPRIATDIFRIRDNSGMSMGYSTLNAFANPMLRNVWESVHRAGGVAPNPFVPTRLSPTVFDASPFPFPQAAPVAGYDKKSGQFVLRSESEAAPRAWIEVNGVSEGAATISRFTRNQITLETSSSHLGNLVLAEPYFPGWKATVDGAAAPVTEARGWMRQVPIPAAKSRVLLTFFPTWFLAGAAVSILSLAICGWLWRSRPASA